ncbi:MAG: Flp family type IVb pilin [Pseudomonadota bacterium]
MRRTPLPLHRCTRGATAMEYAMIAGLISLAVLIVLSALGSDISVSFGSAASAMS